MSETTPGETPVERRLREMARLERDDETFFGSTHTPVSDAIDAGREALALLREWDEHDLPSQEWVERRAVLLARCEGDR